MSNSILRRLIDAMAFANTGNQSEFQRLLEQWGRPEAGTPSVHPGATPQSRGHRKICLVAPDSFQHLAK